MARQWSWPDLADVAARMVEWAKRRMESVNVPAGVRIADVQHLSFPDASFDTVVATCVFCSVADPMRGPLELLRIVKPSGQILLLEYVRPRNELLGRIADAVSVVSRRLFGVNVNRRTEEVVDVAGLTPGDVVSGKRCRALRPPDDQNDPSRHESRHGEAGC